MGIEKQRITLVGILLKSDMPEYLIGPTVFVIHPFDDDKIPPRKLKNVVRKRSKEASNKLKIVIDTKSYSNWTEYINETLSYYVSKALLFTSEVYACQWLSVLEKLDDEFFEENDQKTMKRKTAAAILGVSEHSNLEEIKRAYRNLSKLVHPDLNQDTNEETAKKAFDNITKAYEALINNELDMDARVGNSDHKNKKEKIVFTGIGKMPRELRKFIKTPENKKYYGDWFARLEKDIGFTKAIIETNRAARNRLGALIILSFLPALLSLFGFLEEIDTGSARIGVTAGLCIFVYRVKTFIKLYGPEATKRTSAWLVIMTIIISSMLII